jgi:hypothetical protein
MLLTEPPTSQPQSIQIKCLAYINFLQYRLWNDVNSDLSLAVGFKPEDGALAPKHVVAMYFITHVTNNVHLFGTIN